MSYIICDFVRFIEFAEVHQPVDSNDWIQGVMQGGVFELSVARFWVIHSSIWH